MAENLTSRIQEIKKRGDLYFKSSSLKQKKNDINEFNPQLDQAAQSFTRTLELKNALSGINRPVALDVLGIKDCLKAIHSDLEDSKFNPWNAEKLKTSIITAEQRCNDEWKQYVQERTAGTKTVLQSIKNVVDEEPEYMEMHRAEIRVHTSKACSTEALSAIEEYLNHFNRLIELIHLDDEVLAFLKKLTENGSVPLSSITQSCLQKIKKEKFSSKLSIIIR